MTAKLTGPACRAARALLGWSMRDLREASGVSLPTIQNIEAGGEFFPSTAAKIVDAFARQGVEITNGDGTGAKMRRSYRGQYQPFELKDGSWGARFHPTGYGPQRDVTSFESQQAARDWISERQRIAGHAIGLVLGWLAPGAKSDWRLTLAEVHHALSKVQPGDLREGPSQDYFGEVQALLRVLAAGDAPFASATRADFEMIHSLVAHAASL